MILKPQQILIIIGLFWTLTGLTFVGFGLIYWFHFPYLLYLDEWHFLWAIVALSMGLITGWVLDLVAESMIERLLTKPDLSLFNAIELKPLILLLILISCGIFLKDIALSRAMQGLVDLALGTALIWSSRKYGSQLLSFWDSSQT